MHRSAAAMRCTSAVAHHAPAPSPVAAAIASSTQHIMIERLPEVCSSDRRPHYTKGPQAVANAGLFEMASVAVEAHSARLAHVTSVTQHEEQQYADIATVRRWTSHVVQPTDKQTSGCMVATKPNRLRQPGLGAFHTSLVRRASQGRRKPLKMGSLPELRAVPISRQPPLAWPADLPARITHICRIEIVDIKGRPSASCHKLAMVIC